MLATFIDPHVLAYPADAADPAQIRRYITALLHIRDLQELRSVRLFSTSKAEEIMVEVSGFPPWQPIAEAIRAAKMEEVDAKEVLSVFIGLLQKLPRIEEEVNLQDVLVDQARSEPNDYLDGRSQTYVEVNNRLLAFMGLFASAEGLRPRDQIFATTAISEPHSVRFTAEVIEIEVAEPDPSLELPLTVSNEFLICSCPTPVRELIDAADAWDQAETIADFRSVIDLYLQKYARATGKAEADRRRFDLHTEFPQSVARLNLQRELGAANKVLRACAETIFRDNMSATHAIRQGRAANSPQLKRQRDSASAWRRDIDHELHLHYWEAALGVQLAVVVPHNDLHIPE